MKKALLTLLAVIVLALGGFVALVLTGALGVQDALARRALEIANTYLVPRADYDEFTYLPPSTVEFENFRLVSQEGVEVVRAGRARISFAELPLPDKPLPIETLELEDLRLELVRDTDSEGFAFKGLAPFVRRDSFASQDRVREDLRLDEAFSIRRLRVINGGLTLDLGEGDPMTVAGLEIDAEVAPESDDNGDTWHTISIGADRAPIFTLNTDARLRLSTLTLEVEKSDLTWDLDGDDYSALPPGIQSRLEAMDARGHLAASTTGTVELQNFPASTLETAVDLADFNLAMGEYRFSVATGTIRGGMESQKLDLFTRLELFDGTLEVDPLLIDLSKEGMPVTAAWLARNIRLRQVLRSGGQEEIPRLAGAVSTNGALRTTVEAPRQDVSGSGTLAVREGRLINLPLISRLAANLDSKSVAPGQLKDRADIHFEMTPEGVRIEKATIVSSLVAARGDGVVGYDASLNLELNAGPLEKMQVLLGEVGDVLGAITDRLVTYKVTGEIGDPQVSVQPLGIGGGARRSDLD